MGRAVYAYPAPAGHAPAADVHALSDLDSRPDPAGGLAAAGQPHARPALPRAHGAAAGAKRPLPPANAAATLPPVNTAGPMDVYRTQAGDTPAIVAGRFGIEPGQLIAEIVLPPPDALLPVGTLLLVPARGCGGGALARRTADSR